MSMEHFLFSHVCTCGATLFWHWNIIYYMMCVQLLCMMLYGIKFIQMVPQLKENVNFIMSDFEIAAVKLLNSKFSGAKLTGCWFHFNQAMLRQWRKLHLSNASKLYFP